VFDVGSIIVVEFITYVPFSPPLGLETEAQAYGLLEGTFCAPEMGFCSADMLWACNWNFKFGVRCVQIGSRGRARNYAKDWNVHCGRRSGISSAHTACGKTLQGASVE
jgi:hypothetical protein